MQRRMLWRTAALNAVLTLLLTWLLGDLDLTRALADGKQYAPGFTAGSVVVGGQVNNHFGAAAADFGGTLGTGGYDYVSPAGGIQLYTTDDALPTGVDVVMQRTHTQRDVHPNFNAFAGGIQDLSADGQPNACCDYNQFIGLSFDLYNQGNASINTQSGYGTYSEWSGTGLGNTVQGFTGYTAIGAYTDTTALNTIDNLYGFRWGWDLAGAGGAVNRSYGVYVEAPTYSGGSATVGSLHGIHVADQSAYAAHVTGDQANIYSAGSGSHNTFEGRVVQGAPNSAPSASLLGSGQCSLYLDEAAKAVKTDCRDSGGVVRTATLGTWP